MDKSKKLIIVIILLVVIIGGVSFYAFHQAKENKEMSQLSPPNMMNFRYR